MKSIAMSIMLSLGICSGEYVEAMRNVTVESGDSKEFCLPVSPCINRHLKNKCHPVTGVPFNDMGYPVFSYVYEAQLPDDIARVNDRELHYIAATQILSGAIEQGLIPRHFFNEPQLTAIIYGASKIPGYTWHHSENFGKMQLVDAYVHDRTGHAGGMFAWFWNGSCVYPFTLEPLK